MNKKNVAIISLTLLLATVGVAWTQSFRTSGFHDLVGLIGMNGNQTDVSGTGEANVRVIEIQDTDGHTLDITSNGEITCQ
jgi:hypothetical protein